MGNQVAAVDLHCIEYGNQISEQCARHISINPLRHRTAAIPTQVRRNHAVARLDQRPELLAPNIVGVRKTMQQHDRPALACAGDIDVRPVGADQLVV